MTPFIPEVPPIVGGVLPDSAANRGGLRINDHILAMNHQALTDWIVMAEYVRLHPGEKLDLMIQRGARRIPLSLIIGSKTIEGKEQGFLGMHSKKMDWPTTWLRFQRQGPLTALGTAWSQSLDLIQATFSLIGRFVSGKLSVDNIGGPVSIAQGAGESARSGVASYLFFLALVSISLGVLNLLPIPLLDGGHLLFYCIEFVTRRPLSVAVRSFGIYIGFVFLASIMVLALHNDISRLLR